MVHFKVLEKQQVTLKVSERKEKIKPELTLMTWKPIEEQGRSMKQRLTL
jgi:hypothetical protein